MHPHEPSNTSGTRSPSLASSHTHVDTPPSSTPPAAHLDQDRSTSNPDSRARSRLSWTPNLERGAAGALELAPLDDLPDDPPKELAERTAERADPFFVVWDEGELANPREWSRGQRCYLTLLSSALCFNATFASSLPSGAFNSIQKHFNISSFETTLVTSIFVGGYILGPLCWAPLSELVGRRPVFVATFFLYTILIIPCALAPNIGVLLAFRLLGGVLAACSLTNSGGLINDIWASLDRGLPYATFTISPNLGPQLAPVISGFLTDRYGFRPSFWVLFAFSGVLLIMITFTLPETYPQFLLKQKAARLRKATGDDRYWAKLDREDWSLRTMLSKVLARPLIMLVTEPIVLLISLYLSVVYGVLYLFFELYPAVFQDIHGMNAGVGSLPLICLGIGTGLGFVSAPYYERKYAAAYNAAGGNPVPEHRLLGLFLGGPIFATGLVWIGWSAKSHWVAPTLSGIFSGYGIFWTACLSFLGDCYVVYSASAFASAQIMRSAFGFGFPLFAKPMINRLGVAWTASLLGFISFALCPIPFLFFRFGERIRKASKYASET